MNLHANLPIRLRVARWGAALLAALLWASPALAGSDSPDAPGPGKGPSGSGGSGGGYSAGDETVGTLPSVQGDSSMPGWLLPGERLVLEGDLSVVDGALRLARGHGVIRLEPLDEAGTRVRATFAGDWRLALPAEDLTGGGVSLALEVLMDQTQAVVGRGARGTLRLAAGELGLPIAGLAAEGTLAAAPFALHTQNLLGVGTRLVARERQGLVTLELRTY